MNKVLLLAMAGMFFGVVSTSQAEGEVAAGRTKSAMCAACHGADGNSPSDMFPKLAGQHEGYIAKQLADFKSGARENATMAPMVISLTEQDMADLGAYFASQTISPGATSEDLFEAGQKLYRGGNKETGVPACMACHGPTGSGMPAAKWPALSGQYSKYITVQLNAFSDGTRSNDPNNMMGDIAAKMNAKEIKAVSAYISGLH